MSWEETVRRSSVIRESHRENLISDLRNKPDFHWLVGVPNRFCDRLQGDFFEEFPVIYLDSSSKPKSQWRTVMVVNNTCDLPSGRSPFVSVAPVFGLAKFLEYVARNRKAQGLANFEKDLRKNQISELLFIPALRGFADGALVRLDMICSVPASFLDEAVSHKTRCASFSQTGFYALLMKLTHHLTRMESAEVSRD
ncbi:MAG TPA: hypothetical protein VNQ90_19270 [Chthoniobacteraceae bacterium]|nr:hypothetical protein [Chthoniobacteraceae bacterium]